VKPSLLADQTIQPTQIAGFNQFFSESAGTRSWRLGIGLDAEVMRDVYAGIELSQRNIDHFTIPTGDTDPRKESSYLAYLYWTPHHDWALGTEPQVDTFHAKEGTSVNDVDTLSIPFYIRYFNPSGFFGTVGTTFVSQDVKRPRTSQEPKGNDQFALVDAAVGYRLPERRGIIGLEARNLFNRRFDYRDDEFRTFGAQLGVTPIIPERTILGRFTLSF
jgi:hypothetical protein